MNNEQIQGGEGYPTYIPQNIPVNPKKSFNDQLDFIQELLNKDSFKKHINEDLQLYFETFVKNMAITNFSEADIQQMLLRFDDLKTAYLMQYPPGAYTADLETQFTAMRAVICAELSRSKNGFERQLMATSINQTYMQSEMRGMNPMQSSGGGFFGKVRRMFGRY